MNEVKISTKYQMVVPKEIRKKMNLKPGQKIIIIEKSGIIDLVLDRPLEELRGYLKGINIEHLREEKKRF